MESKVPAYLPYPKQFTPYKWFKPLLTGLLMLAFYFVFGAVYQHNDSSKSRSQFDGILEGRL